MEMVQVAGSDRSNAVPVAVGDGVGVGVPGSAVGVGVTVAVTVRVGVGADGPEHAVSVAAARSPRVTPAVRMVLFTGSGRRSSSGPSVGGRRTGPRPQAGTRPAWARRSGADR
ncbi:hypothetical protein BACI9J_740004 [Bacillus altitudinis]|nr:hypothetical protein BACI9J_740004 [Bacillus altitudinis]